MTDLAQHIAEISRFFWGPENRTLSSRTELRWGNKGSRVISLKTGQWYDHEQGIGGGVVDLIKHEAPNERPSDWLRRHGYGGIDYRDHRDRSPGSTPLISPAGERAATHDNQKRTEQAYKVLEKAVPIAEAKLGLDYYSRRGIPLDGEILASDALWFLDQCATYVDGTLVRMPAIIAKLVDIHTNAFRGISRLFLGPDGDKAPLPGGARKMLGPSEGACCKLTDDGDVDIVLGLGEGIESTLSLRQMPESFGIPCWATMSAGNLAAFPLLDGIEAIHLALDNDAAGQKAVNELARRWHGAGREVFVLRPLAAKADANDILKGRLANGR